MAKTTAAKKTPNKTKNDLSEEVRSKVIPLLQSRLSSAIDIQLQAKQAHWNVKGADFIALHELFDAVVIEATTWVDETAERLVALGGIADGRAQTIVSSTVVPSYPLDAHSGNDHVEALSTALAAFGESVRSAIDEAEEAEDAGTQDLFTGISRAVDKQLWFVESHIR